MLRIGILLIQRLMSVSQNYVTPNNPGWLRSSCNRQEVEEQAGVLLAIGSKTQLIIMHYMAFHAY